jgi:hypothetical protein
MGLVVLVLHYAEVGGWGGWGRKVRRSGSKGAQGAATAYGDDGADGAGDGMVSYGVHEGGARNGALPQSIVNLSCLPACPCLPDRTTAQSGSGLLWLAGTGTPTLHNSAKQNSGPWENEMLSHQPDSQSRLSTTSRPGHSDTRFFTRPFRGQAIPQRGCCVHTHASTTRTLATRTIPLPRVGAVRTRQIMTGSGCPREPRFLGYPF